MRRLNTQREALRSCEGFSSRIRTVEQTIGKSRRRKPVPLGRKQRNYASRVLSPPRDAIESHPLSKLLLQKQPTHPSDQAYVVLQIAEELVGSKVGIGLNDIHHGAIAVELK